MAKYKIEAACFQYPMFVESENPSEILHLFQSLYLHQEERFPDAQNAERDEGSDDIAGIKWLQVIYDCNEDPNIDPRCNTYKLTRL